MSTKTPQEIYTESFYRGVEKECRKHKINCSLSFDKIYIYTKFEEFYFIPNPSCITLMHRNMSGTRRDKMEYHMQLSQKMTPEMVVKYVVRHTGDRYTVDGKRRTNEELAAFNPKKKSAKKKDGLSNKQRKASYKEWTETLVNDLNKTCPAYNIWVEHKNNFVFLSTPFEVFCFEMMPGKVIARNRKCKPLAIKEGYAETDPKCQFESDVDAKQLIDFVIDRKTIWNHGNYVSKFYDYVVERCDYHKLQHKLEGSRIYVMGEDDTYYFVVTFNMDTPIYKSGCNEPIDIVDKDANPSTHISVIRNDMRTEDEDKEIDEKVEAAKAIEEDAQKDAKKSERARLRIGVCVAIYVVSVVAAFVGGYMFALR